MSEWTKQRLDQMIADNVEETLALDYKRADSLAKTDGKRAEVTKDVSSFANSSGGVVVYGIAEFDDDAKRHLPERLDPIQRAQISKEWLDQVIQTIRPKIEGVIIHPVPISETDNTVCYVVEVPQSHTAHMARDHRYYKRQNFNVLPMEDYEVRDVMNRRGQPKLRVSIFINRNTSEWNEGLILVKVENVSSTLAHHFMVDLEIPIDAGGEILVEDAFFEERDGKCFHSLRLRQNMNRIPLFPRSEIVLRRKFHTHVETRSIDGGETKPSVNTVTAPVFADEMPAARGQVGIDSALRGWVILVGDPD